MKSYAVKAATMAVLALAVPSVAGASVDAGFNGAQEVTLDSTAAVLDAASEAAGRPVTIECDTAEALRAEVGWAIAYVVLDGSSVIHSGPTVCGWLAHPETPYTFGQGLFAMIHEAIHLRTNSVDESYVNCTALALMPSVVHAHFAPMDSRVVLAGVQRFFNMTPDSYRNCK